MRRLLLGAALAGFLVLPGRIPAQAESPEQITVRFVTGSVGGTFFPVGREIAHWLERRFAHVSVVVDTTYGSVDNIRRLSAGDADIAIVALSPLRKVFEQHARFHIETFCVLGTLYIDAEQYIIRKNLVRIGSLMDLNGVYMYPGPHKSGGEIDTRTLLGSLDIEPKYVYPLARDKGYTEAAKALARDRFHAATFSGGVPIKAVTDLFSQFPENFVILPFSHFQMNRIRRQTLDFVPVEIPAGSYPGQQESILSVGSPNLLVAGPSMDPILMERIKQAMAEGISEPGVGLRSEISHPVLQRLTPELWSTPTIELGCAPNNAAKN